MTEQIVTYLREIPEFVKTMYEQHLIAVAVFGLVFLFVLFFSNAAASFLRTLTIIALIGAVVYGGVKKEAGSGYQIAATALLLLVVLALVRLLFAAIGAIRQNHINRRIEERALEKAAKRRGSFKNKQGYSGEARPIEEDYTPEKMNASEIREVIETGDLAESPAAGQAAEAVSEAGPTAATLAAAAAAAKVESDEEVSPAQAEESGRIALTPDQVRQAEAHLTALFSLGVLTEEEFQAKKNSLQ